MNTVYDSNYSRVDFRIVNTWMISLLKILGIAACTVVAAYVGGVATSSVFTKLVLPELIRKYPHDGQIGLESLLVALTGALACAAVVFVFATAYAFRKRAQ